MAIIAVRWFGPFGFEDAVEAEGPGLYFVFGRNRRGRAPSEPKLLYVGLSDDRRGVGHRIRQHDERKFRHADNDWWIGRVREPADAGRAELELAEWLIAYFMRAEHNQKKTVSPPSEPCVLFNEWMTPDGGMRRRQVGGATAIADVLAWDPEIEVVRYAPRLRIL